LSFCNLKKFLIIETLMHIKEQQDRMSIRHHRSSCSKPLKIQKKNSAVENSKKKISKNSKKNFSLGKTKTNLGDKFQPIKTLDELVTQSSRGRCDIV